MTERLLAGYSEYYLTMSLKAAVLVGGAQKGMLVASLALISLYAFFFVLPVLILAALISRCPLRI
uniref:Uncharacterized protein n=1 Tax=Parascaris equorum TaxID=6256 RepID=A0A914R5M4_PAREQ